MDKREPLWTAEVMNRNPSTTTFKICGWCKYVGSGSYRSNCALHASCSILNIEEGADEAEVFWDTPCKLLALGKEDITAYLRKHTQAVEEKLSQIKKIQEQKAALLKLRRKVDARPPLLDHRGDPFLMGSKVRVYHNDKWLKATVVSGYRTHDGCVSFVVNSLPESKGGWGCGVSVPTIMPEKDYQYFKKHTDAWAIWKKDAEMKDYNGTHIHLKSLDGE